MDCRISVIMPVYNEQEYLKFSIESILNQTFSDFEFIIIDDGSTDDSVKIIGSYNDSRIKFYKSEKKGIVKQLNYGISIAKAPIIARMDADDISECSRLDEQFAYLNQHPGVDVVGSNVLFINEKAEVVCTKIYPQNHEGIEFMMPIESAVCHPAVMMRKEIFDSFGSYNEKYSGAEDYELFLNLILGGYRFYNIQKILLRYRAPVLKKDFLRVTNLNEISYQLGVKYLNNIRTLKPTKAEDYTYYYRLGLNEYYRGRVTQSRSIFFKCLRISRKHLFRIIRFLSMSLLGEQVIKCLRDTKTLPLLSLYLNKYFNIDLHNIKKITLSGK